MVGAIVQDSLASFPKVVKIFSFDVLTVGEEQIVKTMMTGNKETSNVKERYTKHGLKTKQTVQN
jgi:hypothetical protein